jgi:hypothetical protein
MRANFHADAFLERPEGLVLPQIAQGQRGTCQDTEFLPVRNDGRLLISAIEQRNGHGAIGRRFALDISRSRAGDTIALFAQRILIQRDGFWIGQDSARLGIHIPDIAADHYRCGKNAPHAHLCLVFGTVTAPACHVAFVAQAQQPDASGELLCLFSMHNPEASFPISQHSCLPQRKSGR